MILLPDIALSATTAQGLLALQAEVDGKGTYEARVVEGKRLFGLRNQKDNPVFSAVKRALDQPAVRATARRAAGSPCSFRDSTNPSRWRGDRRHPSSRRVMAIRP